MLEEHQTQHWSLADRAKQGRGLMYLGQLPCKIIMTSKELVDYEIFVLHCTWHFLRATHAFFFFFLQPDQSACTYINTTKAFSGKTKKKKKASPGQLKLSSGEVEMAKLLQEKMTVEKDSAATWHATQLVDTAAAAGMSESFENCCTVNMEAKSVGLKFQFHIPVCIPSFFWYRPFFLN